MISVAAKNKTYQWKRRGENNNSKIHSGGQLHRCDVNLLSTSRTNPDTDYRTRSLWVRSYPTWDEHPMVSQNPYADQ